MKQINYYDVVAAAAQMENAPEITYQKLFNSVQRFTKSMGVELDEQQLREAWREFRKAGRLVKFKVF